MQGGSVTPVGDITNGQPYYDALVAETGCSGANDTLQCLREVPYDALLSAVNQSPGIITYQVRFWMYGRGGEWWLMRRMTDTYDIQSRSIRHGRLAWMGSS
jgi:hypothetical protein